MNHLLPCPFCGGDAIIKNANQFGHIIEDSKYFCIIHNVNCCPISHPKDEIIGTKLYESEEEAINFWNRRV